MENMLKLGMVGFAISVGVVVAYRMSTEAMAVVVGVLFGVLASIPGSLLVLAVLRRQAGAQPPDPGQPQSGRNGYPQVVVIQPGAPSQPQWPQLPAWPAYPPVMEAAPQGRSYTIIGDED